jgi:hypothetical protein
VSDDALARPVAFIGASAFSGPSKASTGTAMASITRRAT